MFTYRARKNYVKCKEAARLRIFVGRTASSFLYQILSFYGSTASVVAWAAGPVVLPGRIGVVDGDGVDGDTFTEVWPLPDGPGDAVVASGTAPGP